MTNLSTGRVQHAINGILLAGIELSVLYLKTFQYLFWRINVGRAVSCDGEDGVKIQTIDNIVHRSH